MQRSTIVAFIFALSALICLVAIPGCGKEGFISVSDPNDSIHQAIDTVTTAIFEEGQPALNAATANLSPETQALVQTAYVALEQAVKKLEASAMQSRIVTQSGQRTTLSAELDGLKGQLSALIH